MPNRPQLDIYKELLYPLCDFLIEQRLSRRGKGENRSIRILIDDFENFLHGTFASTADLKSAKWKLLREELVGLADEYDPSGNHSLLRIESIDDLNALAEGGAPRNDFIALRFSRDGITNYIKKLHEGDAIAATRNDKILTAIPQSRGAFVVWSYRGRVMKIKSRADKNTRKNVCLLLYGVQANIDGEKKSIKELAATRIELDDYAGYTPGDLVSIECLADMLYFSDAHAVDGTASSLCVKQAIRGLNSRAKKVFGLSFNVFEVDGDRVSITDS